MRESRTFAERSQVPILRSYSEKGWSNPKKILDRIIKNSLENRTNHISYETLFNRIMDYFYETEVITTSKVQAESIWKRSFVRIL